LIFCTTGSMLPFDRLTRTVDEWARTRSVNDVVIQIGGGEYVPRAARWVRMLAPAEFESHVRTSDLIVGHLGMGTVLAGMQAQKPMLLLPRLKALGEVNTNHQVDSSAWIKGRVGIWIADDDAALLRILDEFLQGRVNGTPGGLSPYATPELLDNVRRFLRL